VTRIAGRGDPERTLRLLWEDGASEPKARPAPKAQPGPKPTLSVELIVTAAIDLAEGTGAPLSMRALGARLNCTPMALYTYVGGKEELLDLMFDRVHSSIAPRRSGLPAEQAIEWTMQLLDLYLRHPWVSDVSLARPVLGPGEQRWFETLLEVLAPSIRTEQNTATVVAAIYGLTRSAAQTIADARRADKVSDDATWWASRQAAFEKVVPDFAIRFPRSAALAEQGTPPEPAADSAPIMERASRAQLARGVRLLLDNA
jgi:AcrR family transcriptional regulator